MRPCTTTAETAVVPLAGEFIRTYSLSCFANGSKQKLLFSPAGLALCPALPIHPQTVPPVPSLPFNRILTIPPRMRQRVLILPSSPAHCPRLTDRLHAIGSPAPPKAGFCFAKNPGRRKTRRSGFFACMNFFRARRRTIPPALLAKALADGAHSCVSPASGGYAISRIRSSILRSIPFAFSSFSRVLSMSAAGALAR